MLLQNKGMATRWVDNTSYFGPDRRRRPNKRWNDRRRLDEAGEAPPVTALLRRLRVRLGGASAEDRRNAFDMLRAAIAEASRLGWRQCAAALMAADEILRTGATEEAYAAADAHVVRAMEHAAFGR